MRGAAPGRLILLALLSPFAAMIVLAITANLASILFFPAAALAGFFAVAGSCAYGWLAGLFGGPWSGVAVGVGLGATWGTFATWALTSDRLQGASGFAIGLVLSVVASSVAAEVSGRRGRAVRSGGARGSG